MDQLRRILGVIQKQLGQLSATQKLLIASLVVLAVMALFLVSQYAGSPKMVELLPGASVDAQTRAKAHLDALGMRSEMTAGRLMVPTERYLTAVAALGEAGKMPADASVTFQNYIEKQNWMNPKSENDRIFNTALENTLAACLKNFRGIESATVFIDAPEARGMGAAYRKPTASVFVLTKGGKALEPATVDAIAALVASAKAGIDPKAVTIADGTTGRRYAVTGDEDFSASTYMEHVAKQEEYIRRKIEEHLSYIRGVSVAVNAQVDVRRMKRSTKSVKKKGEGSEVLPIRESASEVKQADSGTGGAPGLSSNVGMSINDGQGPGVSSSEETVESSNAAMFGTDEMEMLDPRGMPTKISVTIGVPREYVAALLKQAAPGAAEATEEEIRAAFEGERARIEAYVAPLIETDAAAGGPEEPARAGSVVVSLIPVPVAGAGAAGLGGLAGAGVLGAGGVSGGGGWGLAMSGMVKPVALGALAVLAMGAMLLMVKRASKPSRLPSAEEMVGLPPTLPTSSDLVGEADVGDTAMIGIEVDDEALKTKKMLEEVAEYVKNEPSDAAQLFTRWVQTEH